MDKNPYVWAAAGDITSPVMTISLTANNTPVNVHNLHDPITVTLSSPGKYVIVTSFHLASSQVTSIPFYLNPYLMNGFSHHYQSGESTFIFKGARGDI